MKSLKGLWRFARAKQDGSASSSARKGSAADSNQVVVRQVSSDSELGSYRRTPSPAPIPCPEDIATDAIWYDCNEEFDQHLPEDSPALDSVASAATAVNPQESLRQAYAAVPEQLATIVQRYTQGLSVGCKPTVALMKYMEASAVTLQQLRQQLAPIIAAEQAHEHSVCGPSRVAGSRVSTGAASASVTAQPVSSPQLKHLPNQLVSATPTPAITAVRQVGTSDPNPSEQQQQERVPQQQLQAAQQQPALGVQPSLPRLLSNIELVQETLAGIDEWEGFKQVAWGKLEMWYWHDTANQRQLVKARTVLDEPLVHTVCLAREFDLVTSWNPAILDARELKAYSPSEMLVYILSWCPWPLPCGEVLNYAVGVDLLDTKDKCVVLATNSPSEEDLQGIHVPQHPRILRITMHAGGFKLIPLPPDPLKPDVHRTEVIVLMSMDAKKFLVPEAVISFLLKIFAPLVYKSVMKVMGGIFNNKASRAVAGDAAVKHSALLDRLEARPEYGTLHRHCCKYVDSLVQQQQ